MKLLKPAKRLKPPNPLNNIDVIMLKKVSYLYFTIMAAAVPSLVSAAILGGGRTLNNPLDTKNGNLSVAELVGRGIQAMLALSGVLATLFIILGGVQIMLAQGNADQISKGKSMLFWAFVGLGVAFGGFIVVNFLLGIFTQLLPSG